MRPMTLKLVPLTEHDTVELARFAYRRGEELRELLDRIEYDDPRFQDAFAERNRIILALRGLRDVGPDP